MSVDLDRQLRALCRHMDEKQSALSLEDILERSGDQQVIPKVAAPGRTNRQMTPQGRWIAAAAAALAILVVVVGILFLPVSEPADNPTATSVPSTTTSVPEAIADTLLDRGLPGTRLDNPAGTYGWTGTPGTNGWMHKVIDETPYTAAGHQVTQLIFAVDSDCFAGIQVTEPTAVTVAGLDGMYLEPYDDHDRLSFFNYGQSTAAYGLPIGDRTLCVYLRWNAATTPNELSAARAVVESIRGEPYGEDGIRINFELPYGWDTG